MIFVLPGPVQFHRVLLQKIPVPRLHVHRPGGARSLSLDCEVVDSPEYVLCLHDASKCIPSYIYIYICIAHEKDKRGFVLKEVVICIHDFKN